MPPIIVYFLGASRSIRIAWLLEELGLEYEVRGAEREGNKAPQWMKDEVGGLGKFPVLKDGEVLVTESGCIAEYLCDKYDSAHRLLPAIGDPERYRILQWVHAAEATFMLHSLAILYTRWNQPDGDVKATEKNLAMNVEKDLAFFQSELSKTPGKFLFGDDLCVADAMMEFSLDFILTRELGVKAQEWPEVEQYVRGCQETGTWAKARERTGYKL
ncbi:hypothetical protein LTR62_003042 [Meristemomyces frigidus]|uniref:Glutathione S-transferase n=1 Tax=Meristemomyces frigidus TaxID=1508187 RepID=A0AAN7TQU6_9PEZI|nr:hypothetical protein LTR62_003042 [Meristemomyces frigidus]